MQKRGQLTIFIIVGIILVAIIASLIFIFSEQEKITEDPEVINTAEITNYVEGCIKQTAKESLLDISSKGGYFILPEKATKDLTENVPILIEDGKTFFFSNSAVSKEISLYVDSLVGLCLKDFAIFEDQGYFVTQNPPQTESTLTPEFLIVETTLPLKITKNQETTEISKFQVEIPIKRFYQILTSSEKIVLAIKDNLCLSCISKITSENNLFIETMPLEKGLYLFEIRDSNYFINNQEYEFRFAAKYELEE